MNGVAEEFPSKTVEKPSPFRDRTKSSHNCREQCETILPPLFANFSSSSRAKNIVRTMKIYQAFTSLAPSSPESLVGRTRDNWWQVSQWTVGDFERRFRLLFSSRERDFPSFPFLNRDREISSLPFARCRYHRKIKSRVLFDEETRRLILTALDLIRRCC